MQKYYNNYNFLKNDLLSFLPPELLLQILEYVVDPAHASVSKLFHTHVKQIMMRTTSDLRRKFPEIPVFHLNPKRETFLNSRADNFFKGEEFYQRSLHGLPFFSLETYLYMSKMAKRPENIQKFLKETLCMNERAIPDTDSLDQYLFQKESEDYVPQFILTGIRSLESYLKTQRSAKEKALDLLRRNLTPPFTHDIILLSDIARLFKVNVEELLCPDGRIPYFENMKSITLPVPTSKKPPFPKSAFGLKALTTLVGSNCKFTAIPVSIRELKRLQTLNLSHNKIKTLPDSLGELFVLQTLNLYDNNIELLPASIGRLTSLTDLNLSDNMLETLPDSLGNLSNLRLLILSDNNIEALPDSLGGLKSLTHLNLVDNRLETLPESLGELSSLEDLELTNNMLNKLPDAISNLSQLIVLFCANNELETLPDRMQNLFQLQVLDCCNNPIPQFPPRSKLPPYAEITPKHKHVKR
ncbi:MAG: leucine-rich repeat domain-containing protein [Simkaniaceae bacterium]|nr:leucine-rich repeat domain-containing protein [Simkaniaceae bacterium]